MDPLQVKISLSIYEVLAIDDQVGTCRKVVCLGSAKFPLETLILAEFAMPWYRQNVLYRLYSHRHVKPKKCTLPLSVAKILWQRLQSCERNHANQSLLAKLDKLLTDRSQKPDFTLKIS